MRLWAGGYGADMAPENSEPSVIDVSDRSLSDEELEDLIYVEPTPALVTYSTQDLSIDGLVKRLNRRSMLIPSFGGNDELVHVTGFQRGFVWTKAQMDRFIESLLLGYPVPGIFLVKQAPDNRMLILDGQQRLITLQRFYNGLHEGREFSLTYVGEEFRGLTYQTLDESMQFKLDDSYLQATIVSADGSPEIDDSIYQIFERLNSGGTQLTPHEIRVALYAGPLMASIETLNGEQDWRDLYGRRSKRIRDHELITRILAFYSAGDQYSKPLKSFLNAFALENRPVDILDDPRAELFRGAIRALNQQVGPAAFRRLDSNQLNTAQAEAVCVAAMEAIDGSTLPQNLPARINALLQNDDFLRHTARSTADREAVDRRLELAREALS